MTQPSSSRLVTEAANATVSAADRARGNHTGTQSADTLVDGTTNKAYTAAEKTKLAGIATAATANRADAATDAAIGAAVAAVTPASIGLGNVSNTSDASKPLSTAATTALAAKADLVGGLVPTSQMPSLSLVTAVPVANQAAMLALTTTQVQPGDLAVRADGAGTFILTAADPTQLANWLRLNAPTDAVTTVNGQQGTVVLAKADVGLPNVDNTSDVNKPVSTAQAAAIAASLFGGTVNAITATATAVAGVRNTVDATAAPVTVTLPSPAFKGQPLIITRLDASAANAITITGTINGVGTSTATLPAVGVAGEGALWIAESLTSWTPAGSIKPKAWFDAVYAPLAAAPSAFGPAADLATINTAKATGLRLQAGTYRPTKITLNTNDNLRGVGVGATIIQLADGQNSNLCETAGFSSLVGTSNSVTPHDFAVEDLTLDGGKATNGTGINHVLAIYGNAYRISNLVLRNATGYALWTEWSLASPFLAPNGMEGIVDTVRTHDTDAGSLMHLGPHDTQFVNCIFVKNSGASTGVAAINIPSDGKANGSAFTLCHVYGGSYDYGVIINSSGVNFGDVQVEGAQVAEVWVQADKVRLDSMKLFSGGVNPTGAKGLILGQAGTKVNNVRFTGYIENCGGGAIDLTNANSHINIDGWAYWDAATPAAQVVGSAPSFSTINLYCATSNGASTSSINHTGGNTQLESIAAAQTPLTITPYFGGQTANLVNGQAFKVGPAGYLGLGGANPNGSIPALISTGADGQRAVVIVANSATQTANLADFQNASFQSVFSVDKKGRLVFGNSTPTVAAGAAASAAGADTAGVSDAAGSLTATSLASPVAGVLATVTLSANVAATPKAIILTPRTAAAVAAGLYVSAKSSTAFTVSCANVPAASTALLFDYLLIV